MLTRDQVRLLRADNVCSGQAPGFDVLGIDPVACEVILPTYLTRFRRATARGRVQRSGA
jgi:NADH dehydrogenase